VEVDEVALEALLTDANLLPAGGTDDRAEVEAALGRLLDLLVREHTGE
jgi:hypothetical protein